MGGYPAGHEPAVTSDVTLPALGMSTLFGGPGSEWFKATSSESTRLLRTVVAEYQSTNRTRHELQVGIAVVFQVAGELWQPPSEGMSAGRLTRADRGLVVHVAVPTEVEDARSFVADKLVAAVEFTDIRFRRKRIPADFSAAAEVADRVAVELRSISKEPGGDI